MEDTFSQFYYFPYVWKTLVYDECEVGLSVWHADGELWKRKTEEKAKENLQGKDRWRQTEEDQGTRE